MHTHKQHTSCEAERAHTMGPPAGHDPARGGAAGTAKANAEAGLHGTDVVVAVDTELILGTAVAVPVEEALVPGTAVAVPVEEVTMAGTVDALDESEGGTGEEEAEGHWTAGVHNGLPATLEVIKKETSYRCIGYSQLEGL